jgi:hypothetical protein
LERGVANILTIGWTGTNDDPWTDIGFYHRVGDALADNYRPRVYTNLGWGAVTIGGGDRIYQYYGRVTQREHKGYVRATWKSPGLQGRWATLGLRVQDSGDGYFAKIDSQASGGGALNTPTLYLIRRRAGTDTTVAGPIDLTALGAGSGRVQGSDLAAGVDIWMRLSTNDDGDVVVKVFVDVAKTGSFDPDTDPEQISYTDLAGIQSGGTFGVYTDGNATQDDIVYASGVVMDFEDEADPVPDYDEGLTMVVNGAYLDEETLIERGLQAVDCLQSYASGTAQAEARLSDMHDWHQPMFQPGDNIEILYDGEFYARGMIRPTAHAVGPTEQNSYELYGPKMLARDVVIQDPTSKLGTITFNIDRENPLYDEDKADLTVGEILVWVIDNHTNGQDGLRARGAGPAEGTVYNTIPADLLNGPVLPGVTVSGNLANAVEQLLSLMPSFAWRIDPDTLMWTFEDRTSLPELILRTSDLHMNWKFQTKAQQAKTVVMIRGGEPEIEWKTISLGTGDLEEAWNTALGLEGDDNENREKKNWDEGTVAAVGVMPPGGLTDNRLYVDTLGFGAMVADEWRGCRLQFRDGDQAGNSYSVLTNTSSGRFVLSRKAPWQPGGSPNPGDKVFVTGARGEVVDGEAGEGNVWNEMFSLYQAKNAADRNFAEGKCVKVEVKQPLPTGGFTNQTYGGTVYKNGQIKTSQPTKPAMGLVNYLPGNTPTLDLTACAKSQSGLRDGTIGDVKATIPVKKTEVPYLRVPATGFRGTAYTTDSAKWNGSGEAGPGDPNVQTPLPIDDPGFQYPALQSADYTLMADAMLDIWGLLPRMANVKMEQVWHADLRLLGKRITISDDYGQDAVADPEMRRQTNPMLQTLLLMQVAWHWKPEGVWTEVNCGTMNTMGGVNLDAIRRVHTETARMKALKEQLKTFEEMHNCMKEMMSFQGEGVTARSTNPMCSTQVGYNPIRSIQPGSRGRAGRDGRDGNVAKKLDALQYLLDFTWEDLMAKQPGAATVIEDPGASGEAEPGIVYVAPDGTMWLRNPTTGLLDNVEVDDEGGITYPGLLPPREGLPGGSTEMPGENGPGSFPTPAPMGPGSGFPGLPGNLGGAQKGWNQGTVISSDTGVVGSGIGFPDVPDAPYMAIATHYGGDERFLAAVVMPSGVGALGGGNFYAAGQNWYQDGGDGKAHAHVGGDDTVLPAGANPLDQDGDGFPEAMVGGYEGFLFNNKQTMEMALLAQAAGPTGVPSRGFDQGSNAPGVTDFRGNAYAPLWDIHNFVGYEVDAANPTGLGHPVAGGEVGNSMAHLGLTEDGKSEFASGAGHIHRPGTVVPADGAYYYTPDMVGNPVSGQPTVLELASGDITPTNLREEFEATLVVLGLTVHEIDAPMGPVYADPFVKYWVVEPSVGQFREVEAVTPGTGVNGGDWAYVTPAVYRGYVGGESILPLINGAVRETIDIDIVESAGTVYLNLQQSGGGDLNFFFAEKTYPLDCTPVQQVALTAGTDAVPQINYVYVTESGGTLTLVNATTGWPSSGAYAPIATVFVQSAASVATDGAMKVHAWTDHVAKDNENGHLQHINRWIRQRPAAWRSGIAPGDMTTATPNAYLSVGNGVIQQLHEHGFPAIDMASGGHAYLVNDPTTAYKRITTLDAITQDASGGVINNRWFPLVVWVAVAEKDADCQMFVNLPTGTYSTQAAATSDAAQYTVYTMPQDFVGTAILVARYIVQGKTSGLWVQGAKEDLRGLFPSTSPGGGVAGVSDHGLLSGLGDDDHPHYHNDARGDARYEPVGAVAAHVALPNPHTQYLQTETDPVFLASPAFGISAGDIVNWDTAFGWGDHAGLYDALGTAAAGDAAHVAAPDPHTQYQTRSEKSNANGYASLDGTGIVPRGELDTRVVYGDQSNDFDSGASQRFLGDIELAPDPITTSETLVMASAWVRPRANHAITSGVLTWGGETHVEIIGEFTPAPDDLDTINVSSLTAVPDTMTLVVRAAVGETITLKDGTGNLQLYGSDITVGDADPVTLMYDSANAVWALVNGAAIAALSGGGGSQPVSPAVTVYDGVGGTIINPGTTVAFTLGVVHYIDGANFAAVGGGVQVQQDGIYLVNFQGTIEGGANPGNFFHELLVNGVPVGPQAAGYSNHGASGILGSDSFGVVLNLVTNDIIAAQVTDQTGGGGWMQAESALTVTRIG